MTRCSPSRTQRPALRRLFVISVVVHAPIGLARIAEEWMQWRGRSLHVALLLVSLLLTVLGLRAVWGVYAG